MKSTIRQEKQFLLNQFQSDKYKSIKTYGKKINVFILVVILLASFSSCFKEKEINETTDEQVTLPVNINHPSASLSLAYNTTDSLNPFFAKSLSNISLMPLLYDSLYKLDNRFTPIPQIAESSDISGNKVTVNIRSDIQFSDGEELLASDVVYSFNLAKVSEAYSTSLDSFWSIEQTNALTIVLTLKEGTLNPLNLLDFPIVKSKTAENENNYPIGSGRYSYTNNGENSVILVPNRHYKDSDTASLKNINLIPVNQSSALIHNLEIGSIDACFDDLSSGNFTRVNASSTDVPLNNLVFLGVNSSDIRLRDSALRRAISLCIDRNTIVENAFMGKAISSYTPFNPVWSSFTASSIDTSAFELNYDEGLSRLKSMGYNSINSAGTRGGKGLLRFKLIVNNDNNFKVAAAEKIAASLKEVNIIIEISALPFDAYKDVLKSGNYDFYIGEVKLLDNMDIKEFFIENGAASFGIDLLGDSALQYETYANGTISLDSFATAFLSDMPFVPLCYRKGTFYFTRSITSEVLCGANDVYYNIYEWKKQ